MRKVYFFIFVMISFFGQSQIVDIPDENFKNALLFDDVVDLDNNGSGDADADLNNDGEIQVSEAQVITSLNLYQKGISLLEGIQEFSNLERLDCEFNTLTNIDVLSQNSNLLYLDADSNQISSIDLSSNSGLQYLYIGLNALTSLDVSQNPNIIRLSCFGNNLSNLNIQNGNNTIIEELYAFENPNLTCVQVDDVAYANSQACNENNETGFCVDPIVTYSTNCALSINENRQLITKVYPNPTASFIDIETQKPINKITVYSVAGNVVLEKRNVSTLDVSGLYTGLYLLEIVIEDTIKYAKIIKK